MKITSLSKEVLSEVLLYLADYERLESLEGVVSCSIQDVRSALRELAVQLREELTKEYQSSAIVDSGKIANLSGSTKRVLAGLSPREEKTLLRLFGLVDESR